jgi:hypothetical protein
MSFPLSSLSPKLQAQAAKELYGSKPASAGVSRPLAAPIRQGPPLLWRGSKLMSTIYP